MIEEIVNFDKEIKKVNMSRPHFSLDYQAKICYKWAQL